MRTSVVEVQGNLPGFHVATADDQHRVDAQLFRVGNRRLERRGAEIRIHAHQVRAQFGHDGLGVVDQRFVVVERDDAHLIRRAPGREVARVMLDEEADESMARAEWWMQNGVLFELSCRGLPFNVRLPHLRHDRRLASSDH